MGLDLIGSIFSLIATFLFVQEKNAAWWMSFFSLAINSWLYAKKGIYGHLWLEGFYFFATCYGLYQWHRGKKHQPVSIRYPTNTEILGIILGVTIVSYATYWALTHYTSSTIAPIDALTTALSLVAEVLICYKIITTWILWFITDTLYGILYLKKNLPFHALLMLVYMTLACIGYYRWKKMMHAATPQSSAHLPNEPTALTAE
jgi:nicotinamide mononucleotide transporter